MMRIDVRLQQRVFVYDTKMLKQALRKAGQGVAGDARKLIRAKIGGGRVYRGSGGSAQWRGYKRGHYEASLPGNAPVSVTGSLARSIKVLPFKRGTGVAIRDMIFYALFLQAGAEGGVGSGNVQRSSLSTRKAGGGAKVGSHGLRNSYKRGVRVGLAGTRLLKPRPFLSMALDAHTSTIGDRLRQAVEQGIGWQKR